MTTMNQTRTRRVSRNRQDGVYRERQNAVRQIPVPDEARALSTLPHIDYEDAFMVTGVTNITPEQWARDMLEGAPTPWRQACPGVWLALGLRLGPSGSKQHVLGWEVRRSDRRVLLLGAQSRIGMPAELLFRRDGDRLLFNTFVQKQNLLARVAWAAVDPIHRPTVHHLLEQACRRVSDEGADHV